MRPFRILLALLFIQTLAVGQVKYSTEFLAIGAGARAHAMGGSQVAIVNDNNSAYWNAAGLTNITSPLQIGAMHAEWFGGIAQYDYLTFSKSLNKEKKSVFALSLTRFGTDNIPNTINLYNPDGTVNFDNVVSFSAVDYAFTGSYARALRNPNWRIGGSIKVIRRIIGSFGGAWGFGADLGVQYAKGNWRLGVQARDVTSTFNAWSFNLSENDKQVFTNTGNEIPVSSTEIATPRVIPGAAYVAKVGKKMSLLSSVDFEITTDGKRNTIISSKPISIDPRVGLELDYDKFLQFRLGINNLQKIKKDFNPNETELSFQPNMGLGLRLGRVQLDYAFTNLGNTASTARFSHVFSAVLNFKDKREVAE